LSRCRAHAFSVRIARCAHAKNENNLQQTLVRTACVFFVDQLARSSQARFLLRAREAAMLLGARRVCGRIY